MSNAEAYLKQCLIILEERGKENGKDKQRENSFQAVADSFKAKTGIQLTAAHIALILQDLKDVRQFSQDRLHEDSIVDCINYAALKAELLCKQYLNTIPVAEKSFSDESVITAPITIFLREWQYLGEPDIEYKLKSAETEEAFTLLKEENISSVIIFLNCNKYDFRFVGDTNWKLRNKWLASGKTLPIEYESFADFWEKTDKPKWDKNTRYRESINKHA